MKKFILLCSCILITALPACRNYRGISDREQTINSETPEKNSRQLQAIIEIHAHIIQVPEIIHAVCSKLNISIELKEQALGHQTYTGKSQTSQEITIEASSFEKGRTLLKIGIGGNEQEAKKLLKSLDQAIEKQIESMNPPPDWTS